MSFITARNRSAGNWLLWGAAGVGACLMARRLLRSHYSFRDKVVLITGGSRIATVRTMAG